jgi:murein DD-endopeptidase MepM/ murein hydrolase activator NlpD
VARLLLFLVGIGIGAAGMYWLVQTGRVQAPAPMPVLVEAAPSSEAPPRIEDLRPPLPRSRAPLPPPPLAAEGAPATSAAASSGGQLLLPVQGVQSSQLVDTFTQSRGEGRLHDAIDIMAARGTPVLAVADGRVAKLFNSKPGGLTVYQYDREEKLAYYYAHLDRYAPGLAEGQQLKRGDVLGYVGSTGNASEDAPHLHFAVFVLDADKRWWKGTAVNPYPLLGGR